MDKNGQLYSFGNNNWCLLGIDRENETSIYGIHKLKMNVKISKICCGHSFVCCLNINQKSIYTFGENTKGQCGCHSNENMIKIPTKLRVNWNDIQSVACGFAHTIIKISCSELEFEYFSYGSNREGQCLSVANSNDKIVPVPRKILLDKIMKFTNQQNIIAIVPAYETTYIFTQVE